MPKRNHNWIYEILFNPEIRSSGRTIVIIVEDEELDTINNLTKGLNFLTFPELNTVPYINSIPPIDNLRDRQNTLIKLLKEKKCVVLTSLEGACIKTINKDNLHPIIHLKVGENLNLTKLLKTLENYYEVVDKVEDYGTMAHKGSTIDIFPPLYENPIRIVFEFDEIKAIKAFNPETQVSTSKLEEATIYPPFESNLNILFKTNLYSLIELQEIKNIVSLVPKEAIIDKLFSLKEKIETLYHETKHKEDFLPPSELINENLEKIKYIEKTTFEDFPSFSTPNSVLPNYKLLTNYILSNLSKITFFFSPNSKYTAKAKKLFEKYKIPFEIKKFDIKLLENQEKGKVLILEGITLPNGAESNEIIAITPKELFGKEEFGYEFEDNSLSSEELKDIFFFEKIKEGDYVVHANYGIAIFRGLKELNYLGKSKEFAVLEFANGDLLYLPPEQFNLLSKYIGSEKVELSSLKKENWKSIKKKVQESILKFSRDLLRIKATRQSFSKEPMKVNFEEYELFEDSFTYEETPDQIKVMEEIKNDIVSSKVMDMVVCGDVGFGKTEIAMRTAYLYVLNGKQVMILVPTTILAEQHFRNFSKRFENFGVKVDVISRLKTDSEINKTLEEVEKGNVDILIGTHSLISENGALKKLKNLGLIIIDEEHKFGVAHKENILKGYENVDVLMLSATPIPRTLGMSLANLRDISLITTPPKSRKPIKTFIVEWNNEIIREAIKHEIERGGKVLVINDKVETIEKLKEKILEVSKGIIDEKDVCLLHGQLSRSTIENVFLDFLNDKYKVMVSTIISESGLDMPNVNTVIINNAHMFGLADLHQIRGRVGRGNIEGYAYLIYTSKYILTELQMKRLNAIEEHSDLGAGFRIALKDLEMRGAGNLLGKEQHGNIKSVGYVFYTRMLSETLRLVAEGGEPIEYSDPVVYFTFDRIFPPDIKIPDSEKIEIMLKLNIAFTEKQLNFILEEFKDRYGILPEGLLKLSEIVKFRIYLKKYQIEEVSESSEGIYIRFSPKNLPEPEKFTTLILSNKYPLEFSQRAKNEILLKIKTDNLDEKISTIKEIIESIF